VVLLASTAGCSGTVWYKGNTHTHTTNSDGDSPPEDVVRWYRDHGYDFLVLSDHNVLTDPARYAAEAGPGLLLISGEEVSDAFEPAPEKPGGKAPEKLPVHINALNLRAVVPPQGGATIGEVLQRNVDAIRAADAVPHINHPNFKWALTADHLARVANCRLFEVYNGHPAVHNEGDATRPSLDAMWDAILTGGRRMYGIAVDDAHNFKTFGPDKSNPGRGWVMVRAERRETGAILDAMERGDFYASSGVTLEEVTAGPGAVEVRIREEAGKTYVTRFIGPGGKALLETSENPARFAIPPGTAYVRAKVVASDGGAAWAQPAYGRNSQASISEW
jgi:hypothetical protein